jgi:voltage-gated potassium channel
MREAQEIQRGGVEHVCVSLGAQGALLAEGDAVYYSTVGSNIYPAAPEAQVFMVTLILGGISIFTTTIVTTLGPLLSSQINPILSGKKVKIEPSDHVILVGTSSFSSSVALELASHGIGFVQVIAPEDAPPLSEQPVVRGDPSDRVLKQAGILSAHTVVVAGEDDAANASASLAAKKLNRNARVVVVASSSGVRKMMGTVISC